MLKQRTQNVNFVFKITIGNGSKKNQTEFPHLIIQLQMTKCNVLYHYCTNCYNRKLVGREQSQP